MVWNSSRSCNRTRTARQRMLRCKQCSSQEQAFHHRSLKGPSRSAHRRSGRQRGRREGHERGPFLG